MRLGDLDALKGRFSLTGPIGVSVRKVIDKQPTIDAVPVVRCRECKHWTVDGAGNRWCHMWETHQTHEDVFCYFGERKDG